MLQLRHVRSRLRQSQHRSANFYSLKNVGASEVAKSPSSSPPPEKGFVISYLLNSCGLSPENAVAAAEKVRFDRSDKPDAVLDFLQKQGFSKSQIADLVRRYPKVLLSNPEKSLLPKMEFFSRFAGVSENDVCTTVSKYPSFLTRSLDNKLLPCYDYLKDVIGVEKLDALFRRGSWIFGNFDLEKKEKMIIPNVNFLRVFGVPRSSIELALSQFPEMLFVKHDEFRKVVEEVKGMGFDPLKCSFVLAMNVRTGKKNLASWDRCYELYSKWGWSKDDILMAFRRHPHCMLCSEKKIMTVLEYVVNELGRDARLVAKYPKIVLASMEMRTIPRCSVVQLLSAKGLVKKDWKLSSVISPVDTDFLYRYVTRYTQEIPELYDFYLSKKTTVVEA